MTARTVMAFLLPLLAVLASAPARGDPPRIRPPEGIREHTPSHFALTGARIFVTPERVLERATLVIRDGVVVDVSQGEPPPGARVLDMTGKVIYPGFLDAYSELSTAPADPRSSSAHWNESVHPELRAADHYAQDASLNASLRAQGITARLAAPAGGILKGTSALVTTGDGEPARCVLSPQVAQHVRLAPPRRSRRAYPGSPMGAVALLRQTFYDAGWYRHAWNACRADPRLPRPERCDAFECLEPCLAGSSLVIADAPDELYFLRADRLAREFGLNLVVRGSGREYRRLDAVRATGRAVIVPLVFPRPPDVATAEAALDATLENLLHWDLAPENPSRLERAGVPIAFTTHGLKDASEFLPALRKAVRRGLPAEVALRALTTTPARLFGVERRAGTIEPGKSASFTVAGGDIFREHSRVLETWVDGTRYRIQEAAPLDLRGRWRLVAGAAGAAGAPIPRAPAAQSLPELVLEGEPGKLKGRADCGAGPDGKHRETALEHAGLRDARFSCIFDGKALGREGKARLTAVVLAAPGDPVSWTGAIAWPDGSRTEFVAARAGEPEPPDEKREEPEPAAAPACFEVNYPLGAFGRSGPPEAPELVLFRGATLWTSSEAGVIESGSLLIRRGRILAAGREIEVPPGAVVYDVEGRHITPGIIDCHSHIATDGGINESTQAITAEVRIGDFIDCDDINIYRQLAGGVTCANILHGSANPIGGQNQVIKMRWGALPEEMKLAEAPPGIKFALGENVKQSNWGSEYNTRYPQTRMGVEQIIRDAFGAARDYDRRFETWAREHEGLPPRRDLELDALAEVVRGERWIHCHSYRQDEILGMLRTLDDFGIRIGTFQHVLEGYKVADELARHGAGASSFSDWWAYKFEVYDAIPYSGALMHSQGVVVSFNSDSAELARHLNHEAAKAAKYGGVPLAEALEFVTINPARQLRIDRWVGSLEPGKHADFAVWSGAPLSTLSRCEETWIDGRKYFDIDTDRELRLEASRMRARLVQRILASGEEMEKPDEGALRRRVMWPREDEFCHCREDDHR